MIRELDYKTQLTFEEAEERYCEVEDAVNKVKRHYSGPISRFKRNMWGEDRDTLGECIRVLLPLTSLKSVQDKAREYKLHDSLFEKSGRLSEDILAYLARFKNTGVKLVRT